MRMYVLIIKNTFDQYSLGKVIVHCCHNVERACHWGWMKDQRRYLEWWAEYKGTKILVWVKNAEKLVKLLDIAVEQNIPAASISDAGFVEVPEGIIIGGAIGPVTSDEAKTLGLKKLSLFK